MTESGQQNMGALAVCKNAMRSHIYRHAPELIEKHCDWTGVFSGEARCPACGGRVLLRTCEHKYCRAPARHRIDLGNGYAVLACDEHEGALRAVYNPV